MDRKTKIQMLDDPVLGRMSNAYYAASLLGLKHNTVVKYCQRFGIGRKIGNMWFLTNEEVAWIKTRKGKRGHKRLQSTES